MNRTCRGDLQEHASHRSDQAVVRRETLIGALLGRLPGAIFGWYQAGDPIGFTMALAGAIMLVILFRFIVRRRPSHAV